MSVLQEKRSRGTGGNRTFISSRRERGIALMLVLGFIFILGVLAAGYAASMKVEGILARKAGAQTDVEWLCRSGVEITKYILNQQYADSEEAYESLNQIWAGGPGTTNGFNLLLESISLTKSAWGDDSVLGLLYPEEDPGEDVRCSIEIVDMERKYNINWAAQEKATKFPLEMAFELMGVDVSLKDELIDCIMDWYDEGDMTRLSGVESEYYETLGYTSKNGPIDDLKELLLIKGITPKMFWGNSANQLEGTGRTSPTVEGEEEEPDYAFGLVELFTPFSAGKININTASSEVLQLIPRMDPNRVQFIMDYRVGDDGIDGTWDDTPFSTITGNPRSNNTHSLQEIFQGSVSAVAPYVTVRSATFEVTVTAEMRGLQRTLVTVIQWDNEEKEFRIIYNYWK